MIPLCHKSSFENAVLMVVPSVKKSAHDTIQKVDIKKVDKTICPQITPTDSPLRRIGTFELLPLQDGCVRHRSSRR